jgi:hypothetical protein
MNYKDATVILKYDDILSSHEKVLNKLEFSGFPSDIFCSLPDPVSCHDIQQ